MLHIFSSKALRSLRSGVESEWMRMVTWFANILWLAIISRIESEFFIVSWTLARCSPTKFFHFPLSPSSLLYPSTHCEEKKLTFSLKSLNQATRITNRVLDTKSQGLTIVCRRLISEHHSFSHRVDLWINCIFTLRAQSSNFCKWLHQQEHNSSRFGYQTLNVAVFLRCRFLCQLRCHVAGGDLQISPNHCSKQELLSSWLAYQSHSITESLIVCRIQIFKHDSFFHGVDSLINCIETSVTEIFKFLCINTKRERHS